MTSISSSLSSSYFQQARASMFQKADLDQSGGLNLDEFKAAGPDETQQALSSGPSAEEIFASLDTNSDGNLTQEEMEQAAPPPPGGQSFLSEDMLSDIISQLGEDDAQAFLEALDTDGDGNITSEELEAATESLASALPAGIPTDGGKGAGGSPPSGSEEQDESSAIYDPLDTNEDGVVSIDEIIAANDSDESSGSKEGVRNSMSSFLLSLQEQLYAA